ncbi:hypothetical protein LAZ67_3006223 [Cordylochernes scorpioides]|uniref:Reverse transcriptase/retrotransposon-derived protein RNase H-like domain-containing protein n=1 Tax=Cordylochernes scorpioides TaxID=51811 RepID=A0ABY6KB09_9ARAC|nr:hypothetical protein LAZ67_3006223 [Cordylochernes scorpioides]
MALCHINDHVSGQDIQRKNELEHTSTIGDLFSIRTTCYGSIGLTSAKIPNYLPRCETTPNTKVKAILEYKKPKTVDELRIFLGMLNFYRTFLNNAAETQAILHEYLREAEVQFEQGKQALANTALLAYPDTELPISLCTHASVWAIGSVLQQLDNNTWKPIALFSKK